MKQKQYLKVSDFDNDPEFYKELTLLKAQETIAKLMEEQGVSKVKLADKLGRDKSYVTQILSSGRNLTLKTLSEILFCLNAELNFSVRPIRKVVNMKGRRATDIKDSSSSRKFKATGHHSRTHKFKTTGHHSSSRKLKAAGSSSSRKLKAAGRKHTKS